MFVYTYMHIEYSVFMNDAMRILHKQIEINIIWYDIFIIKKILI
jgi:hypothetical protein